MRTILPEHVMEFESLFNIYAVDHTASSVSSVLAFLLLIVAS